MKDVVSELQWSRFVLAWIHRCLYKSVEEKKTMHSCKVPRVKTVPSWQIKQCNEALTIMHECRDSNSLDVICVHSNLIRPP